MGGDHQRRVDMVSVGGSRDALMTAPELEARVLLVQEHRIDGPGLPGVQAAAMGAG